MTLRAIAALFAPAIAMLAIGTAQADPLAASVDVYAAGSLRGVIAALAPKAAAMGIELKPSFGGAGELRNRIEHGARPDLLFSADMASPRALVSEGRTSAPAIAFARNRLCLVARRSLGLTPGHLVSGLLAKSVRIRTSKPVADPSGDYAMAMFDRMDAAHPGAGVRLRAKADAQMTVSTPLSSPGQSMTAALFHAGLIDVAVTYCSASSDLLKNAPELTSVSVPDAFDPKPLFGLALLSGSPAAARLALLLLSDDGQEAIAASGLIPLTPR